MELEAILAAALREVASASASGELEEIRVRYLGKKGQLSTLLRGLGSLSASERPQAGEAVNRARRQLEEVLAGRETEFRLSERADRLTAERLDITLPGHPPVIGRRHPLRLAWDEIQEIFQSLGFSVEEGPEVETDYYNFEALNIPVDHPARDMHDSFYLPGGYLLRTHTSPVQVRTMQREAPRLPIRIIAPGRVFRRDDDATHSPVFHQIEGLVIDRQVSLADLKGTLLAFARGLFREDAEVRLRPSYFPFTEPSVEVDISCPFCGGDGCRTCKGSGFIEVLGAGMVHPRVLQEGGYDPEEVSGFAFGLGIERVAMLKYGVDDLRLFYQNDLRLWR